MAKGPIQSIATLQHCWLSRVLQPEVAARAIYFGAFHPRRHIWVGFTTVKAILANRIPSGLLDRYLGKCGYSSQLSNEKIGTNAPENLFEPVPGEYGAHGASTAKRNMGRGRCSRVANS
jgi:hypothetical protein